MSGYFFISTRNIVQGFCPPFVKFCPLYLELKISVRCTFKIIFVQR